MNKLYRHLKEMGSKGNNKKMYVREKVKGKSNKREKVKCSNSKLK